MHQQLAEWVANEESNGISQHDERWHQDKIYTFGGSSIATLQGLQSYYSKKGEMDKLEELIKRKIGLLPQPSGIAMQWGNLFEELIKRVVELQHNCTILGENLYVKRGECIAYSPDGLSVMTVNIPPAFEDDPVEIYETIVLHEFKCPYIRMPSTSPPVNYVAQVKMGLDVLEIPTIGLLSEAVFRRCTIAQLGFSSEYNPIGAERIKKGDSALAIGFVGFILVDPACDIAARANSAPIAQIQPENAQETALAARDLGAGSEELMIDIFNAYDRGLVRPFYSSMAMPGDAWDFAAEYSAFVEAAGDQAVGILPWKLFHLQEHYIYKEHNYMGPWVDKINGIIDLVRRCNNCETADEKIKLFDAYWAASADDCFC